jgi:basic membrane protein A
MKKAILIVAAAALVFAAAGCAKKVEAAAPAAKQVTVRLLTDKTGIDDKSFNAAAWRGILEFYGDTWENQAGKGKNYDVITAETQDMYVPNLKQAADEKYDLIIVTGFTWADALGQVAPLYPNQKFMIVDVDWVVQPNVMQAMYAEHEGSFLVGMAAALKAKADGIAKPKFGFIGGIPGAVITKFEVGYVLGVKSVLPDAEIVDYYANDWGKPELAKAQSKNWFDAGVYCIFSAAGFTGTGSIAQAKESRAQGQNVWAIGVDSDQYADGIYADGKSAVLTSMLKQVEASAKFALNAVKDNTFKAETIVFDTKSGGIGFSVANAELNADIVAAVNAKKAEIVAGTLKIPATYAEAKAIAGFPQNLQAKDGQ